MNEIRFNSGHKEYGWLGNLSLYPVKYNGVTWPSVEHAYQAMKSKDPVVQKTIRDSPTPKMALRAGRKAVIRSDWDDIKVQVMENILRHKFIGDLATSLKNTGDARLIEDADVTRSIFWGEYSDGTGENTLGKILMKIRDLL